jgi:hypothetical protein
VVVEIGGRAFILGVTDHNISMLTEIEEQPLIQEMVALGLERPRTLNGLDSWLEKLKERLPFAIKDTGGEFNTVMGDKVRMLERMAGRVSKMDEVLRDDKGDRHD